MGDVLIKAINKPRPYWVMGKFLGLATPHPTFSFSHKNGKAPSTKTWTHSWWQYTSSGFRWEASETAPGLPPRKKPAISSNRADLQDCLNEALVPQGSVLGSVLWNVYIDCLLRQFPADKLMLMTVQSHSPAVTTVSALSLLSTNS